MTPFCSTRSATSSRSTGTFRPAKPAPDLEGRAGQYPLSCTRISRPCTPPWVSLQRSLAEDGDAVGSEIYRWGPEEGAVALDQLDKTTGGSARSPAGIRSIASKSKGRRAAGLSVRAGVTSPSRSRIGWTGRRNGALPASLTPAGSRGVAGRSSSPRGQPARRRKAISCLVLGEGQQEAAQPGKREDQETPNPAGPRSPGGLGGPNPDQGLQLALQA